jgi:hypothetical protein
MALLSYLVLIFGVLYDIPVCPLGCISVTAPKSKFTILEMLHMQNDVIDSKLDPDFVFRLSVECLSASSAVFR